MGCALEPRPDGWCSFSHPSVHKHDGLAECLKEEKLTATDNQLINHFLSLIFPTQRLIYLLSLSPYYTSLKINKSKDQHIKYKS